MEFAPVAFDFVETVYLSLPDLDNASSLFSEAVESKTHGLIVEVAAIHSGITSNHNDYSTAELEASIASWVQPYPKPILINHDLTTNPLGRVMAAKMDKEADGSPFARLQIAVTDPEAMRRVIDGRYLTGSVGGRAGEATCSICNTNWANASAFNLPCKHARGKTYKGKLATLEMKDLSFKEYSFVNLPADTRSGIRPPSAALPEEDAVEDDDWVRPFPARIFALNMEKEEIFEYSESAPVNILSNLKKKEAMPIYDSLRGAFLSSLSTEMEDEEMEDEVEVSEDSEEENLEDILLVSEELSADLSTCKEAVAEDTNGSSDDELETEAPALEDDSESAPDEADEAEDAELSAPDEENLEEFDRNDDETQKDMGDFRRRTHRKEGVEHAGPSRDPMNPDPRRHRGRDVDPDTSLGAPLPRLSAEESNFETELGLFELRVEELESAKEALEQENARLRSALKRGLAERVVDTKITYGLVESAGREDEIAEHLNRSAASLADSLRDLAQYNFKPQRVTPDYSKFPTVKENSLAVENTEEEAVKFVEIVEAETPQTSTTEDLLVDVFMGRRKL